MHTSITKPGHVFNPSIATGLKRVESGASVQIDFFKASACGLANGKVERRRRDVGMQPKRNDRRRTAGGSTPIIRLKQMPLVTSALFAERNRRGREGDRADHQPVK